MISGINSPERKRMRNLNSIRKVGDNTRQGSTLIFNCAHEITHSTCPTSEWRMEYPCKK